MNTKPLKTLSIPLLLALLFTGCAEPNEATRVELPVRVDASAVTSVTTDLGYDVELNEVRVALNNLVFSIAGEAHTASLWQRLGDTVIPNAHAHPGHYQGGEVTGEMPGDFVFDWLADDQKKLGDATLLSGRYTASNFTFARGSADTLAADDPLIGHTAIISGVATKDADSIDFTIVVDSPEGRELVGVPFEATVNADSTGTLLLRLETVDRYEHKTLFDGVDFFAFEADADDILRIEPDTPKVEDAYNKFRRTFQTHDHYYFDYKE